MKSNKMCFLSEVYAECSMKSASQSALSEPGFCFCMWIQLCRNGLPVSSERWNIGITWKVFIYSEHVFKTMALETLNGKWGFWRPPSVFNYSVNGFTANKEEPTFSAREASSYITVGLKTWGLWAFWHADPTPDLSLGSQEKTCEKCWGVTASGSR